MDVRMISVFPGCVSSTNGLYISSPPFHVSADRRTDWSKPQTHFTSSPGMICLTDKKRTAYYQTGSAMSSFLNVNRELESYLVLG